MLLGQSGISLRQGDGRLMNDLHSLIEGNLLGGGTLAPLAAITARLGDQPGQSGGEHLDPARGDMPQVDARAARGAELFGLFAPGGRLGDRAALGLV